MSRRADPAAAQDSLVRLTAIGLAAGRIAIGAGIWLAPVAASRALGFGEPDSRTTTLSRLVAGRDLVLGTWQLATLGDRGSLRRVSAAAAAVDAGDTLAFALAAATDGEARGAGIRGFSVALPAALAGAWLTGGVS